MDTCRYTAYAPCTARKIPYKREREREEVERARERARARARDREQERERERERDTHTRGLGTGREHGDQEGSEEIEHQLCQGIFPRIASTHPVVPQGECARLQTHKGGQAKRDASGNTVRRQRRRQQGRDACRSARKTPQTANSAAHTVREHGDGVCAR